MFWPKLEAVAKLLEIFSFLILGLGVGDQDPIYSVQKEKHFVHD